jgi:hypothetical protein
MNMVRHQVSALAFALAALGGGIPNAHALLDPNAFSGWKQVDTTQFNSAPALGDLATFAGAGSSYNLLLVGRGAAHNNFLRWNGGGWDDLGGTFDSSPSVVTWLDPNTLAQGWAIVGLGTTGRPFIRIQVANVNIGEFPGSSPGSWDEILGMQFGSDVAVSYLYPYLYLAATGSDGAVYYTKNLINDTEAYSRANWAAWQAIPFGVVTTPPGMASNAPVPPPLTVVALGNEPAGQRHFWWAQAELGDFNNEPFPGWSQVGGGTYIGVPAVSTWTAPFDSTHIDVFGQGTDNFIWVESSENGSWENNGVQLSGKTMISHPAAASPTAFITDVAALSGDGTFYLNHYEAPGDPTFNCAACNDGSCQCGFSFNICAHHGGQDPTLGCTHN